MKAIMMLLVATMLISSPTIYSQSPGPDAPKESTPPSAQAPATPAPAPAMRNADVVAMVEAGLASTVIMAKIKASEVDFDTSTPALTDLSKKGVPQDVMTEMITRPKGPPSKNDSANPYMDMYKSAMAHSNQILSAIQHPVTLVADGKSTVIDPLTGRVQAVNAFVKVMLYMTFSGDSASLRIKQKRPEIKVKSNVNPSGHFYLVKTDPSKKHKNRSVKIGRGYFTYESGPDKDWCVDLVITKLNENEWLMVPVKDLKPGEYGIFNGYQLFDFAVER